MARRGGRRMGIAVRPGSVRQARLEAGLTQAGIGGVDVSRVAIHLIEAGITRPSLPTLQLIAERTKKPLTYFVLKAKT
jgi:transcriptional regulator with XRE-family HTH domain